MTDDGQAFRRLPGAAPAPAPAPGLPPCLALCRLGGPALALVPILALALALVLDLECDEELFFVRVAKVPPASNYALYQAFRMQDFQTLEMWPLCD